MPCSKPSTCLLAAAFTSPALPFAKWADVLTRAGLLRCWCLRVACTSRGLTLAYIGDIISLSTLTSSPTRPNPTHSHHTRLPYTYLPRRPKPNASLLASQQVPRKKTSSLRTRLCPAVRVVAERLLAGSDGLHPQELVQAPSSQLATPYPALPEPSPRGLHGSALAAVFPDNSSPERSRNPLAAVPFLFLLCVRAGGGGGEKIRMVQGPQHISLRNSTSSWY